MLTMEACSVARKNRAPEGLAGEKHRLQVDVQNVVPVALGEIDRVVAADDAGIVDQDIDLLIGENTSRAAIGSEKSRSSSRAIVNLRSRSRRRTGVPRRSTLRPGAAHGQGDGLTDAGIGAGHQRRLARQ
jgi:hypothetical protein